MNHSVRVLILLATLLLAHVFLSISSIDISNAQEVEPAPPLVDLDSGYDPKFVESAVSALPMDEGVVGSVILTASIILSVIALVLRRFKLAAGFFGLALVTLIVRAVLSLYLADF